MVLEAVDDHARRQAQEAVEAAHPLGVALGEVVVDRDDVDALAGQRVQVRRQRGDEGLALTGAHLGDLAAVQHDAADHLDVVVAHPEPPHAGLADQRVRLGEQLVERRALVEAALEVRRHGA